MRFPRSSYPSPPPGRRKTLIVAGVAVTGVLGLAVTSSGFAAVAPPVTSGEPPSTAAFAALNPVTPLTKATFQTPPSADMPWARWNFPPADPEVTFAGLEADLEDAAAHHVTGVEIGQGGVPSKAQLTTIYTKAKELGITVSLKVASGLPDATYANTNDNARRTLANFRMNPVNAGGAVDAAIPGPATGPSTIVAVLAYRCSASPCSNLTGGTVSLERESVIDLTDTLTGTDAAGYNGGTTAGHLSWTAPADPADAQWLVISFRAVPFGTTPETLNAAGTEQLTDAYDAYFDGGLGDLVKENAGDFFVDSHASDPWGAPRSCGRAT